MRLRTLIAGTTLLLAGCGKKDDAPAQAPAPIAAPAVAAPRVAPLRLAVSANQTRETTVAAGWAVVVEARVLLKSAAEAPVTLTNPAGAWSDALRLECKGPDGVDHAALFKARPVPEKSIELTRQHAGRKVWVLDSVALPEGTYALKVLLEGLSAAAVLRVTAAPATESPAGAQAKALARISASAWSDDVAKGLAAADAHLASHPKDVAVGFMKGRVLRSQGRKAEALAAFEAALRWAEEQREPGGENVAIVRVIQDLRRELRTK